MADREDLVSSSSSSSGPSSASASFLMVEPLPGEPLDVTGDQPGWFGALLAGLTSWLSTAAHTDAEKLSDEDELWAGWEYVLSQAEQLVERQEQERSESRARELAALRARSSAAKLRRSFVLAAQRILGALGDEQRKFAGAPLASQFRNRIVSDVVHELADRWLVECVKAAGDSFRERYHEEKYAKNVTGAIRDAGFTASLGPDPTKGLTPHVLADIAVCFLNTLLNALREHKPGMEPPTAVVRALERLCSESMARVVELWADTAQKSHASAAKEGRVVQQWAQADREEQERLEKIKQVGTDGRWEGHQPVVVSASEHGKRLAEIRTLLEASLIMGSSTGASLSLAGAGTSSSSSSSTAGFRHSGSADDEHDSASSVAAAAQRAAASTSSTASSSLPSANVNAAEPNDRFAAASASLASKLVFPTSTRSPAAVSSVGGGGGTRSADNERRLDSGATASATSAAAISTQAAQGGETSPSNVVQGD